MSASVVGVFGGAFDPPHLGHALVPAYLRLRGLVDRVVVVPCADHPLGKDMTPLAQRMAWTRAAMEPLGEAVEVSDIEARLFASLGGPSYTLRTLEAIASDRPEATVRLVIGSDILEQVGRWHRWEEIERRFEPIVVPRAGYSDASACALPAVSSTEVRAWMNDSSPQARDRLAASVPAGVLELLESSSSNVVWLVGSGHVAGHAQRWLASRGCSVVQVPARAMCAEPEATAAQAGPWPDAVWIVARDPAVPDVAAALGAAGLPKTVPVLHAAGARLARQLLAPLAARGNPVGTLHPICSLRSERPQARELGRAAFGVEGDGPARDIALSWIGAQPWLDLQGHDATRRRAYHAACSLAANHLAVPLDAARGVLVGHGHRAETVDAALATLLRSSLGNLLALGIPAGVTGPVARGNQAAVEAHLAALDEPTAALYRVLSGRLKSIVAG